VFLRRKPASNHPLFISHQVCQHWRSGSGGQKWPQTPSDLADGLAFRQAEPALVKTRPRGRPPRRVGHNLLLRLSLRQQDVLRFLTDPRVPFTNNLAERDARMMKLRQKISAGFRSEDGAKDFAAIRSVLSTARKQGWDILATMTGDPDRLLSQLQVGDPTALPGQ
jgi:transposase